MQIKSGSSLAFSLNTVETCQLLRNLLKLDCIINSIVSISFADSAAGCFRHGFSDGRPSRRIDSGRRRARYVQPTGHQLAAEVEAEEIAVPRLDYHIHIWLN